MNALDLILTLAGVPVLACGLYLLSLTVLSLKSNGEPEDAGSPHHFRVVVPAHNEERGIAETLWDLRHLDYPHWRYEVVVVADNCTDATADVARGMGVRVLERNDPGRRGKGYALRYAFETLGQEAEGTWDAVVVVDADTVVEPNLLQAFSNRLAQGEDAMQAAYLPARSPAQPLSVITEVAFTAIHVVRSTARERLGLSVGLRGNGMGFSRALLARVSHDAFSRTEDLEFGVQLAQAGVRVSYAGETTVYGDMPRDDAAAATQRSRWIGGRVEMARALVPDLLREALRRRSATLADLAVDLLVPPVSALMLTLSVGITLAVLGTLVGGQVGVALIVWVAAGAAVALHVLDAARRAGRMRALFGAPLALLAYAIGKSRILVRSFQSADQEWIRTARPGEVR